MSAVVSICITAERTLLSVVRHFTTLLMASAEAPSQVAHSSSRLAQWCVSRPPLPQFTVDSSLPCFDGFRSPSGPSLSPPRTDDSRGRASGSRRGGENHDGGDISSSDGEVAKRRKKRRKEEKKARKREKKRAKKRDKKSGGGRPKKSGRRRSRESDSSDSSSSGESTSRGRRSSAGEEGTENVVTSAERASAVATTKSAADGGTRRVEERPSSAAVVDEDAPTPPGSPGSQNHTADTAAEHGTADGLPSTAAAVAAAANSGEDVAGVDDGVVDEDAPTPPASPVKRRAAVEEVSVDTAAGKNSFFAQLHAMERKKGPIGTMHATGGAGGGGGGTEPIQSTDWECQKCGKMNYKKASACDKYVKRNLAFVEKVCLLWFRSLFRENSDSCCIVSRCSDRSRQPVFRTSSVVRGFAI